MLKGLALSLFLAFAFECFIVLLLVGQRSLFEARFIPSISMQPTLTPGDRLLVEKVSQWTGQMNERGAVILFYPPANCMPGWKDLSYDLPHVLGRLTGLPIFPNTLVFIKRIIGIAGDHIRIEPGVGVYVNDKLLPEPYVKEPAAYKMAGEIVVPKGALFVLGDNRNSSEDSHLWGCLAEDRVLGRAWVQFCAPLTVNYVHQPYWARPGTASPTLRSIAPHLDQR